MTKLRKITWLSSWMNWIESMIGPLSCKHDLDEEASFNWSPTDTQVNRPCSMYLRVVIYYGLWSKGIGTVSKLKIWYCIEIGNRLGAEESRETDGTTVSQSGSFPDDSLLIQGYTGYDEISSRIRTHSPRSVQERTQAQEQTQIMLWWLHSIIHQSINQSINQSQSMHE